MQDDPTAPSLEMSQVPRQRQRQEQRLTLSGIVTQIRAEMASHKSELDSKVAALLAQMEHALTRIDEVQALALAQGERRSEDLRKMIAEEVQASLESKLRVLKDDLQTELHTLIDPLLASRQRDEEVFVFVRHEIADRKVRVALDAERRENMDGLVMDLRQSLVGIASLVIAGKAQTQWGLPWWEFWPVVIFITWTCIAWPFYKHLWRPKRRAGDTPGGTRTTQAAADARRSSDEESTS